MLAFWLANTTALSLHLKWDNQVRGVVTTCVMIYLLSLIILNYSFHLQLRTAKNRSTNFNLTRYHHQLNSLATDNYSLIIRLSQKRIKPLIGKWVYLEIIHVIIDMVNYM